MSSVVSHSRNRSGPDGDSSKNYTSSATCVDEEQFFRRRQLCKIAAYQHVSNSQNFNWTDNKGWRNMIIPGCMCFSPARVRVSQNGKMEEESGWESPPRPDPSWLHAPGQLLWEDGGRQDLRWWSSSFHSSLKEFVLPRDHCKVLIESTIISWKRIF